MPNTPRVITNVINLTDVPTTPVGGIHFVEGITERGPFAKPDKVITSWSAFQRLYGGLLDSNDFPLICKRALDKGSYLRVNRVGHYSDVADKSTLSAVLADESNNAVITVIGEFSAGNTFTVTINGIAIAQQTFNTDHATTMEAIRVAIEASVAVTKATVLEGGQSLLLEASSPLVLTALNTTGVTATSSTGLHYYNQKGEILFTFEPIAEGAGYNGMVISVTPNGTNYNSLTVSITLGSTTESFPLTLGSKLQSGSLVLDDSNTINNINNSSDLIKIVDVNSANPYTEINGVTLYHVASGGTNGGAVVEADYSGDSAGGTGLHAFNSQSDGTTISAPGFFDSTLHIAGASYASVRKDLVYLAEINTGLTSASGIKSARESITGTDKYSMIFAGGLKIKHPTTGAVIVTSMLGDIMANISYVHQNIGPWASFANQKGIINNAIGVNADFGSAAQYAERNILSNAQVNLAITKASQIMQWGNFTAQTLNNVESFASVVFTIIYLKKLLEPILEIFLEEPTDIPTFKRIHLSVKPTLDSLIGKAYSDYRWDGDQDATSIENVSVNSPSALQQGQYKVNFYIKTIVPIQEIKLDIVLTSAGVSFDQATSLI